MQNEQFIYWLQGFFEISDSKKLSEKQVQIIKDHLSLVFEKQTPDRSGEEKKQATYRSEDVVNKILDSPEESKNKKSLLFDNQNKKWDLNQMVAPKQGLNGSNGGNRVVCSAATVYC